MNGHIDKLITAMLQRLMLLSPSQQNGKWNFLILDITKSLEQPARLSPSVRRRFLLTWHRHRMSDSVQRRYLPTSIAILTDYQAKIAPSNRSTLRDIPQTHCQFWYDQVLEETWRLFRSRCVRCFFFCRYVDWQFNRSTYKLLVDVRHANQFLTLD